MQPSKQDMFCEGQQVATTSTTASTNVLDFHAHGDDILNKLFLVVLITVALVGAGTVTIKWQTCDAEDFGSGVVETLLTPTALSATDTAGTFAVKNAALPRGLKRYNRLLFTAADTITTAPAFTAFIVDARVEPLA